MQSLTLEQYYANNEHSLIIIFKYELCDAKKV